MGPWHISSRLATAALVGLLALDVLLVATALRSTSAGAIDTSPLSSESVDPSLSPTSTGSVAPAAKPSPAPGAPSAPLQVMLVALDNRHAWRVGAGSCSAGGSTLATTVDGGKTWATSDAKLSRIVRVRAAGNRAAFIIGADASCAAQLRTTSDGGVSWAPGGTVEHAWFRDPVNPKVVWSPGPFMSQPCGGRSVLDLAVPAAGSARVLCANGLVRSTTDNGLAWITLGAVDGAVALAVSADNPAETYVVAMGAADCSGIRIIRVRPLVATACVRVVIPKNPGQIAVSLTKGGGWLAVGDVTLRSTDALVTWRVS